MDSNSLKEWGEKNNVINRTIEGFWEYISNWEKEHPDEFHDLFMGKLDRRLIKLEIKSIQLTHIFNYSDFVYCNISIYLLEDYISIGNYKMVFTLDGEIEDDILDLKDYSFIRNEISLIKNSIKIAQNALKHGAEPEFVSAITGLNMEYVANLIK